METLASLFLYAWLFSVGACVGSFLNVVVYRLPRRKNLAYPGSQCPRCGHAIRLLDNIPILSWLALGGRCRDCQCPIASRYFFVELTVATLFLAVALIETQLTGAFPRRHWETSHRLLSPYETLPFWSSYALHVVTLTTLLGAALIDVDGFRTPQRIFVPVMALAVTLHFAWQPLVDVPDWAQYLMPGWQRYVIFTVCGVAAGMGLGEMVAWCWRWGTRLFPRYAPAMLFAALGAVGGLEVLEIGAVSVTLFAAAILMLRMTGARVLIPLAGIVLVAALPRLLDLDQRLSLPLAWPAEWRLPIVAACLTTASLAALAAGVLAPPQYFAPPADDLPPVEPVQPSLEAVAAADEVANVVCQAPAESPPHDTAT